MIRPALGELLVGRGDERKPIPARIVAEQVQRGLDRDRIRRDPEQVVGGAQLPVDLARAGEVAFAGRPDLLRHLRADDVRVHADAADRAELEERLHDVVVACVEGRAPIR